ncbi:hypothetical protein TIFTF001_023889 [Ficus carica]|uniref:Uncharacterized protein n=1 Tax=Ficus carica TaxID=3494 RepID=A0AA88ALQ3_FICCA|nr:hypothetical protein TIFTF001_023889 [Ficus carica]
MLIDEAQDCCPESINKAEDRTEDVVVDLLSTTEARECEWKRFGSPRSRSPDLFCASSIEASDSSEGGGVRFWLRIGQKRTSDCRIYDTRAGSEVRGRDWNFGGRRRRRHLEAGEGGGTIWLRIRQKRNSSGRISYARTLIGATR